MRPQLHRWMEDLPYRDRERCADHLPPHVGRPCRNAVLRLLPRPRLLLARLLGLASSLRSNLIYFKSVQEAQAAGYTPSRSRGCSGPTGAAAEGSTGSSPSCGVERWPVKVLSEADESEVDTTPEDATVEELRELPRPAELERSLRAPAERQVSALRPT